MNQDRKLLRIIPCTQLDAPLKQHSFRSELFQVLAIDNVFYNFTTLCVKTPLPSWIKLTRTHIKHVPSSELRLLASSLPPPGRAIQSSSEVGETCRPATRLRVMLLQLPSFTAADVEFNDASDSMYLHVSEDDYNKHRHLNRWFGGFTHLKRFRITLVSRAGIQHRQKHS